uniref:Uncharacterized protein n=1 Tax=Arundo donax TaxID=35708 RepID=A0A0A9ALI6_ARUDO
MVSQPSDHAINGLDQLTNRTQTTRCLCFSIRIFFVFY